MHPDNTKKGPKLAFMEGLPCTGNSVECFYVKLMSPLNSHYSALR